MRMMDIDARIADFRLQISDSDPYYETINIGNEKWKDVDEPIDPACACPTCKHHTLAYLRHLHATAEPLGARLATLHNLAFYLGLMAKLREQIIAGDSTTHRVP